ncbi:hypothetical protein LPEG9_15815 (plasmid) [Lacticaseibacillus paracasei]|nr:hypothetical protein LPEG9_15815 [Lacticaseibacillus paracasei]
MSIFDTPFFVLLDKNHPIKMKYQKRRLLLWKVVSDEPVFLILIHVGLKAIFETDFKRHSEPRLPSTAQINH